MPLFFTCKSKSLLGVTFKAFYQLLLSNFPTSLPAHPSENILFLHEAIFSQMHQTCYILLPVKMPSQMFTTYLSRHNSNVPGSLTAFLMPQGKSQV